MTVHGGDAEVDPDPVKTVAFSASTTVSGPLEYVGSPGESTLGTVEDRGVGHRPYAEVGDLSGRIALTAAGSLSIRATRILEERGAEGVIAIHEHDREPHDGIATPVWGGAPRYDERDRIPRYAPAGTFARLDDDRRFLALQLRREQNGVTHELRRLRASIPTG